MNLRQVNAVWHLRLWSCVIALQRKVVCIHTSCNASAIVRNFERWELFCMFMVLLGAVEIVFVRGDSLTADRTIWRVLW